MASPSAAQRLPSALGKSAAPSVGPNSSVTGEGIVVDYTITGYRACSTGVAVDARGNRQEVERRGEMKPLGQLLGVDFLEGRIGKIGLCFEPETERYFEGDNMVEPRHAITTRVVARRRAG